MILSHLCIRRPVMTTLLTVAIIILGAISYNNLPVSDLPNADFPVISVTAELPGASPDTMASSVASPLEKQFSNISGLNSMNSTNGFGRTQITLQFTLNRNIDAAAQDVQAAISAAQEFLPHNMPSPPTYRKVNPADLPVIYIGMSSDTVPLSTVDDYAENLIAQRISTLEGVAQVSVMGAQKYAVRIEINPNKLADMGIGVDELEQAIQQNNVLLPTGIIETPSQSFTLQVEGQLKNAAAYRPLIIAYRNGAPVRLEDVALVRDDVENNKVAGWVNSSRAIILAVERQPGSNSIEISKAVRNILPFFKANLPAEIKLEVIYDRAIYIQSSINEVKHTLLWAMSLVILVMFLFLRNTRATFIAGFALPVSVIGAFAGMHYLNYSLDNLSLLALILSVGFVVDDAIVMLENIIRHMEEGLSPIDAAFEGSKEIGFTIISMTLSLVAVFIPVLFMGGVVGRLLHEFSVTIALAILVSGFTSLTLTPMLCSRILRKQDFFDSQAVTIFQRVFQWLTTLYSKSLEWTLRNQEKILGVFVLTIVISILMYLFIPKGFIPDDDLDQLLVFTEGSDDFSFIAMVEHQQKLANIVAENPNVETYVSIVGTGGTAVADNAGIIFMHLKPRSERNKDVNALIEELRPKLNSVPGIKAYLQNPPYIQVGGQLTNARYQYTLQDTDLKELYHWTTIFEEKFKKLPGFLDVSTDLSVHALNYIITIERDKAATLGVTARQIEDVLGSAFGTKQISTIYTEENQYEVIIGVDPKFQIDPFNLSKIYLRSNMQKLIPLSEVISVERGIQALSINHLGQLPSTTISFNLAPGTALGNAVNSIEEIKKHTNIPETLLTSLQGSAQTFASSLHGLDYLVLMAILAIYIVLGILYESFIHPLTIISGIPAAGVGALLMLILFRMDLNLYAFTGIIMLIGIVKKNAIMMVDFAVENQRLHQKDTQTAIYDACLIRFRPIMMTTVAAFMGVLPIALIPGSRQSLGLAVVGGLIVSQLLTLYLTPVIYLYLDKANRYLNKRIEIQEYEISKDVI